MRPVFFIKPLSLLLVVMMSVNFAHAKTAQATNTVPKTNIKHEKLVIRTPLSECTSVHDSAVRLVCYDRLYAYSKQKPNLKDTPLQINELKNGVLVSLPTSGSIQKQDKQAIVLSDTIKSALTGDPEIVLVQAKADYDDQLTLSKNNREVLTEIGVSDLALTRYTPLSLAFDLDSNSERGLWSSRPHNANYILPLFINAKPNRLPNTPNQPVSRFSADAMRTPELKFQVSLKTKAAQNLFGTDADLWLGYTQMSHWQVYNENNSRPFRAHDYEPEIFLTQPVSADLPFNGKLRVLGVGAVHHSNGESDPLSRTWNRAYIMGGAEWGKLTVMPRVWQRVIKSNSSKPDDNPDILDYYGYGDVKFLYQLDKGKTISGLLRYNPKTNKGAVQLDYVRPIHNSGVSGYVQLFQGYGQSLVDYNHESTSIGVGIMLNDWMGL